MPSNMPSKDASRRDIRAAVVGSQRHPSSTELYIGYISASPTACLYRAGMGVPVAKIDRLGEAVNFGYRHAHTRAMDIVGDAEI